MAAAQIRTWAKRRETPLARSVYCLVKGVRSDSVPLVRWVHSPLYLIDRAVRSALSNTLRMMWTTPLFQSRLTQPAHGLFLYGGIPLVLGPVRISIGEHCRISGQTTISGRSGGATEPVLSMGRNCDIGWQSTIAVGSKVTLGDNVRIAGRAFLAGYPGHPIDEQARAAGSPDTEDQVGAIILEDDVWLATGVTVLAGVRIGRGAIVGAGSVVTKDIPAFTLAAGSPARVIKQLP
jgi:acetyltransferase-like isoleucine patch superfamily enzyme